MVSVALFGARRTHEWLPQPRDIESHFRRFLVRFFLKLGFRLCAGQCMHGFYAVPVESNKAEQSLIMTWRACAIRISRFFRWYAERSHEGCASRKSSNNCWSWSSNAAPVCVMSRLLWPTHGLVLETWRAIGIWYLQMWHSKPDVTFLNCCGAMGKTWLYARQMWLSHRQAKGFQLFPAAPNQGNRNQPWWPKQLVVVDVCFMCCEYSCSTRTTYVPSFSKPKTSQKTHMPDL